MDAIGYYSIPKLGDLPDRCCKRISMVNFVHGCVYESTKGNGSGLPEGFADQEITLRTKVVGP